MRWILPRAPPARCLDQLLRSALHRRWAGHVCTRRGTLANTTVVARPATAAVRLPVTGSALCGAFFRCVFVRRSQRVPIGTVVLTTFFHADAAQLEAQEGTAPCSVLLRTAISGKAFRLECEAWSAESALLASGQHSPAGQRCPKRQRPGTWPGLLSLFDGGQGGNRTPDTGIFNPLLYRLSYLAARGANSTALRRGRQVLPLRATAPGSPAAEPSLRRRRTFPSRLPGTCGPAARSG